MTDTALCERCKGPRDAGYGLCVDAPPEVLHEPREQSLLCYTCNVKYNLEMQALTIYVVAGRDACDALDMINECGDSRILDTLLAILNTPGTEKTDIELNELLVGPVKRALAEMTGEPDASST